MLNTLRTATFKEYAMYFGMFVNDESLINLRYTDEEINEHNEKLGFGAGEYLRYFEKEDLEKSDSILSPLSVNSGYDKENIEKGIRILYASLHADLDWDHVKEYISVLDDGTVWFYDQKADLSSAVKIGEWKVIDEYKYN